MIKRLHSEISSLRDRLEKLGTLPAYASTSDGMGGFRNEKDGAVRYQATPRICGASVRLSVSTGIAQHSQPWLQSRSGGCESVTPNTAFRTPPAAVLSHQTKCNYKGIPSAGVPGRSSTHMQGSHQQITPSQVEPGVSLRIPNKVALKCASHPDPTCFKGSTMQLVSEALERQRCGHESDKAVLHGPTTQSDPAFCRCIAFKCPSSTDSE